MKKIIFSMAVLSIAAMSCNTKKDYKCTCKTESGGQVLASSSTIINDTEDNAKKACNTSATALGITTTCAIE